MMIARTRPWRHPRRLHESQIWQCGEAVVVFLGCAIEIHCFCCTTPCRAMRLPKAGLDRCCTASPSKFCFVISLTGNCMVSRYQDLPPCTRPSLRYIHTHTTLFSPSSSPSRTCAPAVTDALYLGMHPPTRDDADVGDPPCQTKRRLLRTDRVVLVDLTIDGRRPARGV